MNLAVASNLPLITFAGALADAGLVLRPDMRGGVMAEPHPDNQAPLSTVRPTKPHDSAATGPGGGFSRPTAIRREREILLTDGPTLLEFDRPIDAAAFSESLHDRYFVCQTREPWRFDETDGATRVRIRGEQPITVECPQCGTSLQARTRKPFHVSRLSALQQHYEEAHR